jgi:MoaA/NifB/PqqE/SkfB family radical SAM enzyme
MRLFKISQLKNYIASRRAKTAPVCTHDPVTICLFVTDRCTLSCKWCLRQKGLFQTQRPDMTIEDARRILAYFPKATHLSLAGFGEPLLVNDIFRMASEFRKRPMRCSLITNGTLLEERLDEVMSSGLHRVSISINSPDAKDYRDICGGTDSTFGKVMKGVRLLSERRRSRRPYIHISFVLTKDILGRINDIIGLARDAGADFLDLHNLIAHGDDRYKGMLCQDDREVIEELEGFKKKDPGIVVKWPRLVKKGLTRPERICPSLWEWLGVDAEGNTAGCSKAMPASMAHGNLFKEGAGVWNNGFRKDLRASFLSRKPFVLECCASCTEVQP